MTMRHAMHKYGTNILFSSRLRDKLMKLLLDESKNRFVEFAKHRIPFIYRDYEVKKIIDYDILTTTWIRIIVGPKGTGKSKLIEFLVDAISKYTHDFKAILFNLRNRTYRSYNFEHSDALSKALSKLMDKCSIANTQELFRYLLIRMNVLIGILKDYENLRRTNLVLVFDDVQSNVYFFQEFLKYMPIAINRISRYLILDAFSVIVTTSDPIIIEKVIEVDGLWNTVHILWNMDSESFKKLIDNLDTPIDNQILWTITGGNLYLLNELIEYGWDIRKWIANRVIPSCISILSEFNFKKIGTADPDTVLLNARYMLRTPLLFYVKEGIDWLSNYRRCEWIGRYAAWISPLHYAIAKVYVEKGLVTVDNILSMLGIDLK